MAMAVHGQAAADVCRGLAQALVGLALERPLIVALPPGGMAMAIEIARTLQAPLDMLLVRGHGPARADRPVLTAPPPLLRGRAVVVVDDGSAEPEVWQAALAAVRQMEPGRIVIAVPQLSAAVAGALAEGFDHLISAEAPPQTEEDTALGELAEMAEQAVGAIALQAIERGSWNLRPRAAPLALTFG